MFFTYCTYCSISGSVRLRLQISTKFILLVQISLSTGVSFNEAKLMGLTSSQGTGPMPRDMSFPVPKGGSWHDLYDYIRYGNFTWEQHVRH